MENKSNPRSSDALSDENQVTRHGWLRRVIGTLNFIVVIIFLGAWITGFIFLNQYLSSTLSGNLLTALNCISFFGGLILAFLIAAVAGGLLRRFFWKSSRSSSNHSKN